jgi:DNA-binding Xre family transcriptional regulator
MTITENMTPIDKRCIELGISRTELSKRSGVPLRTLESWSRRVRIPRDVYQLHKVAQALNCHIEDIIEPEPDKLPAND